MNRFTFDEYFIEMAITTALRSTCLRRNVGALLTKDNKVISTGYNGSKSGQPNCIDTGKCIRLEYNIPSGERLDFCIATHAEINAISQAAERNISTVNSTLYCTTLPCIACAYTIIAFGINRVVYVDHFPGTDSLNMFQARGIEVIQLKRRDIT